MKKSSSQIAVFALVVVAGASGCKKQESRHAREKPEAEDLDERFKPVPDGTLAAPLAPHALDPVIAGYEESLSGAYTCVASILWELLLSSGQKAAYALVECDEVVVKENDLRGGGGHVQTRLYLLGRGDHGFKVIDADSPASGMGPWSGKRWAKLARWRLPRSFARYPGIFDLFGIGIRMTRKAGRIKGISIPRYVFSHCERTEDCPGNHVCYKRGLFNGLNRCVRACSDHRECGAGYSCRSVCLEAVNSCPDKAFPICHPDLLHHSLPKTGRI